MPARSRFIIRGSRFPMTGGMAGGLQMTLRLQMTKGLQPGKVEPSGTPLNNERQRITKEDTTHTKQTEIYDRYSTVDFKRAPALGPLGPLGPSGLLGLFI